MTVTGNNNERQRAPKPRGRALGRERGRGAGLAAANHGQCRRRGRRRGQPRWQPQERWRQQARQPRRRRLRPRPLPPLEAACSQRLPGRPMGWFGSAASAAGRRHWRQGCRCQAAPSEREDKVAAEEEATYLVEKLLESRAPLKRNERETYRSASWKQCSRHGHKEYLVKFVGYDEPYWVCQCDIGEAALREGIEQPQAPAQAQAVAAAERQQDTAAWRDKQAGQVAAVPVSSRTRHAGRRAATLSDAATGDFAVTPDDTAKDCNTLKSDQYAGKILRTTAGVLALVSSCGLFLAVDELVGSESLTQVHLFLFSIFFAHKVPPPEVLAYDDACHLLRFWQNRVNKSAFVQWLLQFKHVQLVVDRFHFKNHIGKFCKMWVGPAKCGKLKKTTSTEATEQSFSWLARSKHTLRNMGEGRFQFMVLHLMEHRNRWLVSRS